jgi:hypothetical protein
MHLGDFGTPIGALSADEKSFDTVGVGGLSLRLRPADRIPMFPMSEFARLIALGISAKDMSSMSTVYGVLEACTHPDDFGRLRIAASDVHDESIVGLVFKLYERWATVPLGGTSEPSNGSTPNPDAPSKSSAPPSKRVKRREPSETPAQTQARMEKALGVAPDPS